jgi:hypothetical protein
VLRLNFQVGLRFELYDLPGKLLLQKETGKERLQIEMKEYVRGIYVLKIFSKKKI